jgi:tight adherence protein B
MIRRWLARPAGALAVIGTAMTATLMAPALAQNADEAAPTELTVRSIDATAFPEVSLTVMAAGGSVAGSDYTVELDGEAIANVQPANAADAGLPIAVMWAIDTSHFMNDAGGLDAVKAALVELFAERPANQVWGITAFQAGARPVVGLTADAVAWQRGVDALVPSRREAAAMRDAVAIAINEFKGIGAETLQRNVIVVGSGADDLSSFTYPALRGDVLVDDVAVHAVHYAIDRDGSGEADRGAGEAASLARETGGLVSEPATAQLIGAAMGDTAEVVTNQYVLRFQAPADVDVVDVTVRAGEANADAAARPGEVATGPNVSPDIYVPIGGNGPSFLQTDTGKLIGGGLLLTACVLLAVSLGLLFVRSEKLDDVLSAYADPFSSSTSDADEGGSSGLATSKFVQQAVDITSKLAERRGIVSWFDTNLERADIPLRGAELVFFSLAGGLVGGALGFVLTGNLIMGLVALGIVALLPAFIVKAKVARRRKQFTAILPDMLNLLAGSLKAGYSLMQGLEAVSKEVAEPVGREMRRICIEARLGRPLDEALNESAERMGIEDYSWAILAVSIQREVGGNLAELLMTVSDTMVQRERLRRDVSALTAEGRMSAIVLCILPPGVTLAMKVMNPAYINVLFEETVGQYMLGAAVLLMVGGFFWMKKTVEVDI